MSEQTKPTLLENHHTWLLLSDGSVIVYGHALFQEYAGQQPGALKTEPSKPRTVDRREFEEMTDQQKWETVGAGIRIVDPGEEERKSRAARAAAEAAAFRDRGVTIKREAFEQMPHMERHKVIAEGARIVD